MGANGSAFQSGLTQAQQDPQRRRSSDGRLKSRSQSSYGLDCIKASCNNNGTPGSHHREDGGGRCYYNLNSMDPGKQPHPPSSGGGSGNGLSSSIPADLWDLPPNSQSYSPCRYRRKTGHHDRDQQTQQPTRKTRFMQLPVLEALINLSKKGKLILSFIIFSRNLTTLHNIPKRQWWWVGNFQRAHLLAKLSHHAPFSWELNGGTLGTVRDFSFELFQPPYQNQGRFTITVEFSSD